jgi:hypothetical protein
MNWIVHSMVLLVAGLLAGRVVWRSGPAVQSGVYRTTLAVALFWVQPLVWVLSRRLEATAEDVCDDLVVQFGTDRARYAGHLLELASRALPPAPLAGVRMVAMRSMLARRVVRILDSSRSLSTSISSRAGAAIVVAGTIRTSSLASRRSRPGAATGPTGRAVSASWAYPAAGLSPFAPTNGGTGAASAPRRSQTGRTGTHFQHTITSGLAIFTV